MRKLGVIMVGLVLAGNLVGCAASQSGGEAPKAAAAVAVPANSPLAKIQMGMTKRQVKEVLGAPSDENTYLTGKAWIPWYFGNDARRTSYFYKGVGRVVFADGNIFGGGGGGEVVRVDHDPSEAGIAP